MEWVVGWLVEWIVALESAVAKGAVVLLLKVEQIVFCSLRLHSSWKP